MVNISRKNISYSANGSMVAVHETIYPGLCISFPISCLQKLHNLSSIGTLL